VPFGTLPARVLTLLAVMVAWVFFAAPTFDIAASVLGGMFGLHGLARPEVMEVVDMLAAGNLAEVRARYGTYEVLSEMATLATLGIAIVVIFALPNSQEIVDGQRESVDEQPAWRKIRFRPTVASAVATSAAFIFAFSLMSDVKEFVYFQF
jgi:hypothetical protein